MRDINTLYVCMYVSLYVSLYSVCTVMKHDCMPSISAFSVFFLYAVVFFPIFSEIPETRV